MFNNSAMAALAMQAEGRIRRIAILDCDVHRGNGTASIVADDPTVVTFSIHGARNFPLPKKSSDLDIELPDGTGDAGYMDALERGICHAHSRAGRNRDSRWLFGERNRYRGHPFLDRASRRALPSRTATACCSSPRRTALTRPLSLIALVFARRFASSRFEEVRPSILISKYKNFLTGLVRLLELVSVVRLGHNI